MADNNNRQNGQGLEKAYLHTVEDDDKYDFTFMFNPNEISISRKAVVTENRGARSQNEGIPKVSFAHPNATIIKIKDIIFDVYESKTRDLDKKLEKLTQTVKFVSGKERPPIYIFCWGKVNYLRCYVESLDYQLTLFLPDGTPVRAKASISLKEVDPSFGSPNPATNSSEHREQMSRWNERELATWV